MYRAEFLTVVNSMMDIGFDEEEIEEVYIVLAAIILIGDIVSQCSQTMIKGTSSNLTST